MHIFYAGIQIHFKPAAANTKKVLYDAEGFLRERFVLPELLPHIQAPVSLEVGWFSVDGAYALTVELEHFSLKTR